MKWAWAIVLAVLVAPRQARADYYIPRAGASIGPTLGYAHARDLGGGMVYGVDAAAAYTILWAGGGVRLFETFEADERKVLPYVEVGIWLLINVGGGYTVDLNQGDTNASGSHFFIGVPVPVGKPFDGVAYLEPYYRATYADVGTLHEGGAFLKWGVLR